MVLKGLKRAMEGMRPEALAVKTGLSVSTIEKARRGGNVTMGTAMLIAHSLKTKITALEEE